MPKVSVIIPVYNVEQYIERCAKCLFEQTLDDLEYIFINDCTPDKSMEVLASTLKSIRSIIRFAKLNGYYSEYKCALNLILVKKGLGMAINDLIFG